jgi:tRNA(Ile)-lysidine synthase
MFISNNISLENLKNFKRIGIGFSGGLDSCVLLHSLSVSFQDTSKLVAIHINHGISKDSDLWEKKCKDIACDLNIPFYTKKLNFKDSNVSEDTLREARYKAFEEWAQEGDLICTAHHKDDQLETIFFRLMRGTGIEGLKGIPVWRKVSGLSYFRPFLDFSKKELFEYAVLNNIKWTEDKSNLDVKFSRNFIRNSVFPLLLKFWPGFGKSLQFLSKEALHSQSILDEISKNDLESCRLGSSEELSVQKVNSFSYQRIRNLLYRWLSESSSGSLSVKQMEEIINLISQKQESSDHVILISSKDNNNSHDLRMFKRVLYLLPKEYCTLLNQYEESEWNLENDLLLPTGRIGFKETKGKGLSLIHKSKKITVRGREGGERCKPFGRNRSQKLKKLLQESDTSPWLRDRLPLIYVDKELAAVADLWVCDKFHTHPEEVGITFSWTDNINK